MPQYDFQKRFAPAVKSREKRQTYRKKRKNRPKPGQTAYLFFGLRTAYCERLGEEVIEEVIDVLLGGNGIIFYYGGDGEYVCNDPVELDEEAHADGFENWIEMRDWFLKTHGLPVELHLTKW